MLSGLKFVPREQIEKGNEEVDDDSRKRKHKSSRGRGKGKSNGTSSDEEAGTKIKRRSRKKKQYDTDEDFSSDSDRSSSQSDSDTLEKKRLSRKKEKKRRSKRKESSRRKEKSTETESEKSTEERGTHADANSVRKEMGLEWMLHGKVNIEKPSHDAEYDIKPEEVLSEQANKHNPRELNPYFKDNGSGYPEEFDGVKGGNKHLLSNAVVGDGGASWRLKALKRSQEQAAREGRKLKEVVEERWGAMGSFAASVPSRSVAPTHAHLHAINQRRKGLTEDEHKKEKDSGQKSTSDVTPRHPKMRLPNVKDSLSWGKRGKKHLSVEDNALLSAAMSNMNKFSDDGSFMDKFAIQKSNNSDDPGDSSYLRSEGKQDPMSVRSSTRGSNEDSGSVREAMSANQLAAKAMQLRMKGKHEEAETLLKETETIRLSQSSHSESGRSPVDGTTSRVILHDVSVRQKDKEEDADRHLANRIMHNHRYNVSGQADEEYDYEDGPRKKTRKQGGGGNNKASEINNSARRILTQQERCQFCFENPKRPKHLVIAIANFTYLSLPQRQSVVPGHCGILTLQHEMSTRTVDDNVWDEFRNFKKCLIMMFAKQEKDLVFLETVMGLGQQKRHCMVECVPIPSKIAKQAPVYFKKAIDEAEDEWSQHNAKKLIDTSEKGLRSSIPKNFPYFHVEFGLNRGFVHVIDNERDFKSNFGINVIRGMLQLPAEDMHRRQKQESEDSQRQSVASFTKDWQPFDWTKQLS